MNTLFQYQVGFLLRATQTDSDRLLNIALSLLANYAQVADVQLEEKHKILYVLGKLYDRS